MAKYIAQTSGQLTEVAAAEPAPVEAPVEAPVAEPAPVEAPVEAPVVEALVEAPVVEAPVEAPVAEPAPVEAPVEAPVAEPAPVEAPVVEAPVVEVPVAEPAVVKSPLGIVSDRGGLELVTDSGVYSLNANGNVIRDGVEIPNTAGMDYMQVARQGGDLTKTTIRVYGWGSSWRYEPTFEGADSVGWVRDPQADMTNPSDL